MSAYFVICWPCILVHLWVNDQLDAELSYTYKTFNIIILYILLFKLSPCCKCNLFLFWVIPRRLRFNCRRFGTHYRFHLHRQVNEVYFIHPPMKMEPIVSSETSAIKSQTPGNYPKRNKLLIRGVTQNSEGRILVPSFYVLLAVHPGMTLANNQNDA